MLAIKTIAFSASRVRGSVPRALFCMSWLPVVFAASASSAAPARHVAVVSEPPAASAARLAVAQTFAAWHGGEELTCPGGRRANLNPEFIAELEKRLAIRPCWLEVWAGPPAGGEPELRHAGWIEQTSVEPGEVPEEEVPAGLDDGGVHSPVIRITAPAQDSSLTFTLYSYEAGLVDEINAVPGSQTVDLSLPTGNCWYWVGGWREADGELVLSRWLRHQTRE